MKTVKNWWTKARKKHISKYLRWNSLIFFRQSWIKNKKEGKTTMKWFSASVFWYRIVDSETFKYLYGAVSCDVWICMYLEHKHFTSNRLMNVVATRKSHISNIVSQFPVFQSHYRKCNDLAKSLTRHSEFYLIYSSLSSSNNLVEKQVSSNFNNCLTNINFFLTKETRNTKWLTTFSAKISFS